MNKFAVPTFTTVPTKHAEPPFAVAESPFGGTFVVVMPEGCTARFEGHALTTSQAKRLGYSVVRRGLTASGAETEARHLRMLARIENETERAA